MIVAISFIQMQSEGKGSSKSKAVARVIINTKKNPQTDTVFVSFFHRNPKSVREREREIVRESTIEETSTAPRPLTVSIPFHATTRCVHPRFNKSAGTRTHASRTDNRAHQCRRRTALLSDATHAGNEEYIYFILLST